MKFRAEIVRLESTLSIFIPRYRRAAVRRLSARNAMKPDTKSAHIAGEGMRNVLEEEARAVPTLNLSDGSRRAGNLWFHETPSPRGEAERIDYPHGSGLLSSSVAAWRLITTSIGTRSVSSDAAATAEKKSFAAEPALLLD
jgi:hypothetical protein